MAGLRVHHLNCGTFCPPSARLVNGQGPWFGRGHLVSHVLVVETSRGLLLVDSGLGTAEVGDRRSMSWGFRITAAPALRMEETARVQIEALGYDPKDVRDIIVTHLDLDHAGGIADFPWATVHVHASELEAARQRKSFVDRQRYMQRHIREHLHWRTYRDTGEPWMGFEAVRALDGLGDDIAMIPLFGHTRGHVGVALRARDRWLLHAGDAIDHRDELEEKGGTFGLLLNQRLTAHNYRQQADNRHRLAQLKAERSAEVTVFCAHDPVQFDQVKATSSGSHLRVVASA